MDMIEFFRQKQLREERRALEDQNQIQDVELRNMKSRTIATVKILLLQLRLKLTENKEHMAVSQKFDKHSHNSTIKS
jgi:hypothetical protein